MDGNGIPITPAQFGKRRTSRERALYRKIVNRINFLIEDLWNDKRNSAKIAESRITSGLASGYNDEVLLGELLEEALEAFETAGEGWTIRYEKGARMVAGGTFTFSR